MRNAQLQLFDKQSKKRYTRTAHGGSLALGKRKLERPLSSKEWIHLVLKSDKAKGSLSLLSMNHKPAIVRIIEDKAQKFGVKIADQVYMRDHVHLKIRIHSRPLFQKFLRAITTLIARKVTGARRGKPFGKFWQGLAFTRVLKSYKEELMLRGYFHANRVEKELGFKARERSLERHKQWLFAEEGWKSGA
jgi:REP element-mobilizing transposase RayT